MADPQQKTFCKRHPHTESYLGCSRCGDLICSECMIQSPVGARCPDHGTRMRNPAVQASGSELAKAIAAGVGSSVALNLVYIALFLTLGTVGLILAFIAPAAIGYAVGEAVYRASGYTRNKNLAWVAAGSVLGGFVIVSAVFIAPPVGIFGILIGMYLAYQKLKP